MLRVHDEGSNQELVGFLIWRKAHGTNQRVLFESTEEVLIARLYVFGVLAERREVHDLQDVRLLGVSEHEDLVDLLGNRWIAVVEVFDQHQLWSCVLTVEVSGDCKRAKHAAGRPLDQVVMRLC